MDFLLLTQFGSFIETIPSDQFDITTIISGNKRCAIGWSTQFDERVDIDEAITVKWTPTGESGYAPVASNLFDIQTHHARQLFHCDNALGPLAPWIKTRTNPFMSPRQMKNRIGEFVEYFESHPQEANPPVIQEDLEFSITPEEIASLAESEELDQEIDEYDPDESHNRAVQEAVARGHWGPPPTAEL